jgi:hypothetical protein
LQIRVARAFGGPPEARQRLLRARLLAFYSLFQAQPSPADMMALFQQSTDFVQQVGGCGQAWAAWAGGLGQAWPGHGGGAW